MRFRLFWLRIGRMVDAFVTPMLAVFKGLPLLSAPLATLFIVEARLFVELGDWFVEFELGAAICCCCCCGYLFK
jgi:hypothetical protein